MKTKIMKYIDKKTLRLIIGFLIIMLISLIAYLAYFKGLIKFMELEKEMQQAAETYYDINYAFLPEKDSYREIKLNELYTKELLKTLYVPYSNKFCDIDKSFVRVININDKYYYLTHLDCGKYKSRGDFTAPEIKLNEGNKIIIGVDSEFNDPGIKSVKDNKEGKMKISDVKVEGEVNTAKSGNYKITYSIRDKNFNTTKVERLVVVADTLNQFVAKKTNNTNIFASDTVENYVFYSGMVFRILKVNENGSVKIFTDNPISLLNTSETSFKDSGVEHWLNNDFLNSISDSAKKILSKDSEWCIDNVDSSLNMDCQNKVKNAIGLLNIEEAKIFSNENAKFSYTTLLMNKSTDGIGYVLSDKNISTISDENFYGVKPTLNIINNSYIISGDGTIDKPLVLIDNHDARVGDKISTRDVGEFINYSGMIWRISKKNKQDIELVSTSTYKINNLKVIDIQFDENQSSLVNYGDSNGIGGRLVNEYINYIDSNALQVVDRIIPVFSKEKKYYEYDKESYKTNIAYPYSYQMFSAPSSFGDSGSSTLFLADNVGDNKVLSINGFNSIGFTLNKMDFARYNFKVIINIDSNIKIKSGIGSYDKPFIIK